MRRIMTNIALITFVGMMLCGCASEAKKDGGWVSKNIFSEAEWIRNGEPFQFEGKAWYPQDSVENLLDSEVYPVGEHKGVQVFVEFTDVKPYDRMYTRYAKNRFRLFQQKNEK